MAYGREPSFTETFGELSSSNFLGGLILKAQGDVLKSQSIATKKIISSFSQRLQELEAIANAFPGVEKSYALQAGREVRIFVTPEKISDLEAKTLAHDIAAKIETDLKYPGEIKVNVIRELRVVEYAR